MTQLSPVQIACVTALFFATSIGALEKTIARKALESQP